MEIEQTLSGFPVGLSGVREVENCKALLALRDVFEKRRNGETKGFLSISPGEQRSKKVAAPFLTKNLKPKVT